MCLCATVLTVVCAVIGPFVGKKTSTRCGFFAGVMSGTGQTEVLIDDQERAGEVHLSRGRCYGSVTAVTGKVVNVRVSTLDLSPVS